MNNQFLSILEKRRSIYSLGNNVTLAKDYISELINHAVKLTPSAFHSQSTRVVVLFGDHHLRHWALVKHELGKLLTASELDSSASKIDACFASGFGTVLFFEDTDVIKELEQAYPLYADNFEKWSEQANGMAQLTVWTALAEENLGATLQHYNPLIDTAVANEWQLPESWKLIAQMPFGTIENQPDDKEFISDLQRQLVFE
ncbi:MULTISPECIES: nitroreductase family protein [Vibrio]|uniref:Nitroreductase family protein n=1 Tax=Vibrio neptunius TaxID=170651 RepID=A0ABS2ZYQ5_9VIBR|nr:MULTISPECIES: nitroreductase family protein [Vibrio]MBN3492188.1 nitroreductase family protein [Vibrio neptunius]MBN3514685.1 nitroreductase family protein [Vibrio neptunius]MBN3549189.1 nitroreductase family protein [Vibrio neptunius]MBN3576714.1 nitroreductase family protein [Vibrio neptunius]MCH9870378.1 nitroreductase family protein [Vibrio neptunius]